jgi:hypothetical protein
MQLGKNSIYKEFEVFGQNVVIQANRNYSIIDIEPRIPEIFSKYYGRQLFDINVLRNLVEDMSDALKPVENEKN